MRKRMVSAVFTGLLMLGLTASLNGCPGQNTVEVWIVNSSGEFIVTSVKLMDSDTTTELVTDEGVSPTTVRTYVGVDQEPFAGETVSVVLTGRREGIVDTADTTVTLPEAIVPGMVIPIVVSGEGALSFDGEYIPLDETSKLRQQMKAYAN